MRTTHPTARPTAAPATADPAAPVSQLALADVSKTYGDRTVLDQVSFTLRPGEKAAVIGENGSGKSTLMRLIAGAEAPDHGRITRSFPGGTGHLAQTLGLGPDRTVRDAVDSALHELRTLEARIRAAEAALSDAGPAELDAYGDLLGAYEARDGYCADARTDAALHGLGIGHIGRERTLGSLSGGEQSRLALACVLGASPELLLLDEPTNHLDGPAVAWLAERLRAHRGTLVVITHDRAFVEAVATTVLEVDRDLRTVTRYGDGWAGYRAARARPVGDSSSATGSTSTNSPVPGGSSTPPEAGWPAPARTRARASASTGARTRPSSPGRSGPRDGTWTGCCGSRSRRRPSRSGSPRASTRTVAPCRRTPRTWRNSPRSGSTAG